MRKVLRGLVAVGLVVAIGACGEDDDAAATEESTDETGDEADTNDVEVLISGSAFDPSEVEVTPGEVSFTVTNEDSVTHTFTVDEVDISVEVPGGETATATGSFSPGDYELRCEIHSSMTGTISVIGGL